MKNLFYKMISTVLAITMLLSLVGCGETEGNTPTSDTTGTTAATEAATEATGETESAPTEEETETTEMTETLPAETVPVETVPVETVPSETTPPETVPAETIPTEATQPPETKPAPTVPPEPEEVKPVSISAKVSGNHQVGDKLSKSDFTVTVTMSDGTVLKNPSGWSASTLTLSNTSNKITVSYEGVKTTITVTAKRGAINGMEIAKEAIQYLNLTYVHGGNSLTTGTDCSGFTSLIYKQFGISLPRTAAAQSKEGTTVTLDEAKPGDLYAVEYTDSQYTGHAGIYIGNGWMISAWPGSGVQVTAVDSSTTFHRIFENSYSGSDEDAVEEIHAQCFSIGMYGTLYRTKYNIETGIGYFDGESPLSTDIWNVISLTVYLNDIPKGYKPLVEAWKKDYLARGYLMIYDSEGTVGYLDGIWYSTDDLWSMYSQGLIDSDTYDGATDFYGAFWDSSAVITNGLGETVDLSTFTRAQ